MRSKWFRFKQHAQVLVGAAGCFFQFSTNKCTDLAYKGRSVESSSRIDAFSFSGVHPKLIKIKQVFLVPSLKLTFSLLRQNKYRQRQPCRFSNYLACTIFLMHCFEAGSCMFYILHNFSVFLFM